MAADLREELRAAARAVRLAARACRAVSATLGDADTVRKADRSPVTVADFASQAVVCAVLERERPGEAVVAEEDSLVLRRPENQALREAVQRHAAEALGEDSVPAEQVLSWIDRGGADSRGQRFWTLDPIDGTKGFLRGGQYAIALALVEEGRVVAGALGCPRLPAREGGAPGALFVAAAGMPAYEWPLWEERNEGPEVRVAPVADVREARLCESVEPGHSDQRTSAEIARLLSIHAEPYRIDSQCKYAAVARGDAAIYLRLPTREDYRETIWDHAAGALLVERAGGRVTDIEGRPLDFSRGRRLEANQGVVATNGILHDVVLDAVRRVRVGR